jgi:cathepsin A (carboxypeptidase C)
MKVATSALLLGAAASTALAQEQQPLGFPESFPESYPKLPKVDTDKLASDVSEGVAKPMEELKKHLKELTSEASDLWEEVAQMFPESMSKASFFSEPKPHQRRPDSEWLNIVRGVDVESLWTENAYGETERELDGKLSKYNLRVKKPDPASLGVDKVKQYSGYLDDEEEDKHFFYCKSGLVFGLDLR